MTALLSKHASLAANVANDGFKLIELTADHTGLGGWSKGPPTSSLHRSCVVAATVTVTFDRDSYVTRFCESNTEGIVFLTGYRLTHSMNLGLVPIP